MGRGGLDAGRRMQQLMCVTQPTCSLLHSMYVFMYVTPSVQRTTMLCASLAGWDGGWLVGAHRSSDMPPGVQ